MSKLSPLNSNDRSIPLSCGKVERKAKITMENARIRGMRVKKGRVPFLDTHLLEEGDLGVGQPHGDGA
jgi:hypothetical protein